MLLSETEIRCAFYKAVAVEFPGLSIANSLRKMDGASMTLDEIKSMVLQLEAHQNRRQAQVNRANAQRHQPPHWQLGPNGVCYRRNQHGHREAKCL